ncbi:MAG: orotidine-5'-phosphate decarboxylase [Bacillota bacterium]|nr:orotidine-5'-phosphate decarboxylase [Bacillota bacterium]
MSPTGSRQAGDRGRPFLFLALDGPAWEADRRLVERLLETPEGRALSGFKIGPALFTAYGPEPARWLAGRGGELFLDLKLHDIPAVVAQAVRAAAGLGARWLTVHAGGGRAMLEAACAARDEAGGRPGILAVTVLTSLEEADLAAMGFARGVAATALRLAELALAAGVDGLVASAHEVAGLRRRFGPGPRLAVPGLRLPGEPPAGDDQRRVASPAEAALAGADLLVLGRLVRHAPDPVAALGRVLEVLR